MTLSLEMIDQSLCRNAIEISQNVSHLSLAVRYYMGVVGHDHVGKDHEAMPLSRLCPRVANDLLEHVGLEDRQPSVRDRGQVIGWAGARYAKHLSQASGRAANHFLGS